MSEDELYIGLVHYPVLDRQGAVVATSTVSYDVHDLARAARTYGVRGYYLITPLRSQLLLVERLLEHWTRGAGARYNPRRREALGLLRLQPSLEAALEDLRMEAEGRSPLVLATSARRLGRVVEFDEARRSLENSGRPHLLLFGTGWGLAPEALLRAEAMLPPLQGVGPYNHLSVRAAAAVVLDRLRGRTRESQRPSDQQEAGAPGGAK